MQSKACESQASLPSVLKGDLRAAAREKGPPATLEKNYQFWLQGPHACSCERWAEVLESVLKEISTGVSRP